MKKKNKWKRGEKFLLLLVIFAVLLAGNLLLSRVLKKQSDAAAKDGTISVTALDSGSVSKIAYTYQGETVSLVWNNTAQAWENEADPDFPVKQSYPRAMLSAVVAVTSDQQFTEPESLAEYGLDAPDCVITVTDESGAETVLSLGDQNSFNQEYYLTLNNDSNTVYTVAASLHDAFAYSLFGLIQKDTLPEVGTPGRLEIDSASNPVQLVYFKNSSAYSYTNAYCWFWKDAGESYAALDSDKANELISLVTGLSWGDCVAYQPTADQLAQFGLSTPSATIRVYAQNSEKASITLLLGSYNDDTCYAMLEGSEIVCEIPAETADSLLFASFAELRPSDVCMMDWSTVESMTVACAGEKASFSFSVDSDGKPTGTLMNDATVSDSDMAAALELLDSMTSTGEEGGEAVGTSPELTLTFYRNTGTFAEMTMTFTQYDSNNDLLTFNGESRLLVSRKSVASLQEAFLKLMKPSSAA